MKTIQTPVLIVGGGPVGLSLAIDLGWRKVDCTLVEQEHPSARQLHPRMDNVGIRTMEFCRRWGIVDAIEQAGFPRDLPISIVYATSVLGYELAKDSYPDKASAQPPPFSPQKHELCPQNFFDPVMQAAASAYPRNELLFRTRLTEIQQTVDQVVAIVQPVDGGDPLRIEAHYLAACDGAASTVVQLLGLMPASNRVLSCSTNIFIRCPELARRTAHARAYRYILIGSEGIWGSIVNINGRDIWRLQLLGTEDWPAWSDAEIDQFVRRGVGDDVAYELISWVPWSRREAVADKFRVQRCFLVGDCAHQLSPTGGYGMNTGIADAIDISWKLTAMIEGWGGPDLLDSYETERRPVAIRNVTQASANLAAMRSVPPEPALFDRGALGNAARERTGRLTQAAMQREWRSFGIHLGATYRHSPIVIVDGAPRPEDDIAQFVQRAEPGMRAPHVWLRPGRSTLDLFGRGFVLLDFAATEGTGVGSVLVSAAKKTGVPIELVEVASADAAKLYERRFVLVRPDGIVAWRGDMLPHDPHVIIDTVRGAGNINGVQTATQPSEQINDLSAT